MLQLSSIQLCQGCKGLWLGRNEWEALKKRNLHDDLNLMVTAFWQKEAQRELRKKRMEVSTTSYSPYQDDATNTLYALLFCDDLSLFRANFQGAIEDPWKVLFADPKDTAGLEALASNLSEESRLRILAFNAMGKKAASAHPKELLGVVIEVGLEEGLDTLAAYKDLRARYINQSGKMIIWETNAPTVDERIKSLFQDAARVVEKIGPWEKARLPPPTNGLMRMTFLVSDGLYFGQGTMKDLQRDPLGAPVVNSATELLIELTSHLTTK